MISLKKGIITKSKVPRKKRRQHHAHQFQLKRFQHCAQKRLTQTMTNMKATELPPKIKQTIRKVRRIASVQNIKYAYQDKNLRMHSVVTMSTALLMGVFTGGIVSGVVQAAASSVVSSAISKAYKAKEREKQSNSIDEVMEMARAQHSHSTSFSNIDGSRRSVSGVRVYSLSSPRKKRS